MVMHTAAISATIRAYSTIVAASSFRTKRRIDPVMRVIAASDMELGEWNVLNTPRPSGLRHATAQTRAARQTGGKLPQSNRAGRTS